MTSQTLHLMISDMACSGCAKTITQAIMAIDPAAQVVADVETKRVEIETQQPESVIHQAIVEAGYTLAKPPQRGIASR